MKFTSDLFPRADAEVYIRDVSLEFELRGNLEVALQVKTTMAIDKQACEDVSPI